MDFGEKYIQKQKEIQQLLLDFIDSEDESEFLSDQQNFENRENLSLFLHILSSISKNHHRKNDFINKIEQIILFYQEKIERLFTNFEIFNFFKGNKQIILFLLEKNLIKFDKQVIKVILNKNKSKFVKYTPFFYPELKLHISDMKQKKRIIQQIINIHKLFSTDYKEKRQNGENESYVCQLIRQDSIKEFIIYVTKTNFPLSSKIKPSIFETNPFLIKNEPSLIEYSAFYGSIQIFQYLKLNNIELTPSLWLYVIHGRNPELIHILEENFIEPEDKTFEKCFIESIKCHHNEIATYIYDNKLDKNVKDRKVKHKFDKDFVSACFRYYNVEFIQNDFLNYKETFFIACKYDYFTIVDFILKKNEIYINEEMILKFLNLIEF